MNSLVDSIKYSEGYSDVPYKDDKGVLTIGYGTNISKISKREAELLLMSRINNSISEADSALGYEAVRSMSEGQREAVYELCYWIGLSSFVKFKKMINAIMDKNWSKAGDELLDSKLGREYTTRAKRLANKLKGY
jgi:GH24 family phage-related lysozyme (muramidase)